VVLMAVSYAALFGWVYYIAVRRGCWMTTAPNGPPLFGNSSKPLASSLPTALKTAPISGNEPAPPTPTSHHDLSCCSTRSPNDSDGKPNTPPPNSPQTDCLHHPSEATDQAA
jgi:hypothetical protein